MNCIGNGKNSKELFYGSLDSCLGPGSSRFFGSGYKRVTQTLTHITTDGGARPGALVTARGTLTYPRDWSRKSGAGDLRPHLSSIDALVLAANLAEVHIARAFGLDPAERRRIWLRHADVRAGSSPHEELTDFPVEGRLVTVEGPADDATLASTFECRVGRLKVRCTLVHAQGGRAGEPVTYSDEKQALGPARSRHYGAGYKQHEQHAEQVRVDLDRQQVSVLQRVVADDADATTPTCGAEAAYGPSVSLVDALVGVAQLAQILLYAQDGLSRGDSDTLWMRRFVISARTPVRPLGRSFVPTVRTENSRILPMGDTRWRTAELAVDDFAGIGGRCWLAHRLPDAA
ncbi:AvrD family protein [Streptomyces longispororuber]|uniref:AvrD family protein n=1 Tax=Streptomyces longispororuber TaxID=68230 RepID=UPI00210AA306|nr:AvrD family protein [Streptomyces longispororuber]MCQ4208932.1 AvrD family protein [Streptomyces longispororuber]